MIASFRNTLFTGKVIHRLDETLSTNMYASLLLQQKNVAEGTIVIAENQTAGRGYSGDVWQSEPGKNLLASIIYNPHFLKAKNQFFLNQAVSLGVYDALKILSGKELKLKWPNDIVFKDKKLCGLLIENSVSGNWLQHSIIGIGVNVNQTEFPVHAGNPVSLKAINKKEYFIEGVLEKIAEQVEARYLQFRRNEIQQLQRDYMEALYRLEEEHFYKTAQGKVKAKIVGLNPEGKLLLESKTGWNAYGFKEVEFLPD
ncbi:MAG: biotin--[acetyl-CoA-carboxylase] ligase [Bacteroidota bacterium]